MERFKIPGIEPCKCLSFSFVPLQHCTEDVQRRRYACFGILCRLNPECSGTAAKNAMPNVHADIKPNATITSKSQFCIGRNNHRQPVHALLDRTKPTIPIHILISSSASGGLSLALPCPGEPSLLRASKRCDSGVGGEYSILGLLSLTGA